MLNGPQGPTRRADFSVFLHLLDNHRYVAALFDLWALWIVHIVLSPFNAHSDVPYFHCRYGKFLFFLHLCGGVIHPFKAFGFCCLSTGFLLWISFLICIFTNFLFLLVLGFNMLSLSWFLDVGSFDDQFARSFFFSNISLSSCKCLISPTLAATQKWYIALQFKTLKFSLRLLWLSSHM